MALTAQAQALTDAHRAAQTSLSTPAGALAIALWRRIVDPEDLEESVARWVLLLVPQLAQLRLRSEALARRYIERFRELEIGEGFEPDPPDPIDQQAIVRSLHATGGATFRQGLAKVSGQDISPALERALISEASEEAAAQAGASALRHVRNGGREQVIAATKQDRTALGYVRVTKSAEPCYFCVMLTSRGPVYKEDSFSHSDPRFLGAGEYKAHDSCACTLEPVYTRAGGRTQQVVDAEKLWNDHAVGSGADAINSFRSAYEALLKQG